MSRLIALWKRLRPAAPDAQWEDYFDPGETLLWEGAPEPGSPFSPVKILMSLFGLPFLGLGAMFMLFGLSNVASFGSFSQVFVGFVPLIIGLSLFSTGFGLSVGPWIVAGTEHAFVRYAITDRRAYVARSWWRREITSYPVGADTEITLRQARRDRVSFYTRSAADRKGTVKQVRVAFDNITDGPKVTALLRQLQVTAKD